MKNLLFVLSIILFSFTSCNKEDIGANTMSSFSIKQKTVANKSTNDTKNIINPLKGSIKFKKVYMGVRNIELKSKTSNPGNKKLKFEGPYMFDVLNGTSSPDIEPIFVEPNIYNKVAFELDNILKGGNSIEVTGTFVNDLFSFEFEYTTTMKGKFLIKSKKDLQQFEGDISQFIVYLDLNELFKKVAIENIKFDENIVKINKVSNPQLASILDSNLEKVMDIEIE